jgi:hypothetical protein
MYEGTERANMPEMKTVAVPVSLKSRNLKNLGQFFL